MSFCLFCRAGAHQNEREVQRPYYSTTNLTTPFTFKEIIEPQYDKTNKMMCAPCEDSDQHGYPPSLIRVSAVRFMGS